MSNLAIDAAFARSSGRLAYRFGRLLSRREDRVGDSSDIQRLSLSSAGYLYAREGAADRQHASESTERRSLRIDRNQLVINPMWLTGGSVAISEQSGAVSPDYRVFGCPPGVLPRYLHHLLRSKPYMDQYNLFVRANTTFDRRIQQDDLDQLPLWLPPFDQQQRIADFLDDRVARIDRITEARSGQRKELELHRRGALVEAIFHDRDRLVPCSQLSEIRLGRQRSPQHESGDHMVPYLRSANVGDGRIDLGDVKRMNFTPDEQRVFGLQPGDILVTEGSASPDAVGASATWEGDIGGAVCFQNTLIRLRARPNCSPDFLAVWARASHAAGAARVFAGGASILHLGSEGMSRLQMPLLPLGEQRSRAATASKVLQFHAIADDSLRRSVELLLEYKQSLITAAVTGELDVTTARGNIGGREE
ncbi:hypothetical protein GCM10025782_20350 [Pedococcus ginsenosidimutans]|uniref:Type I restriction modification DNA specificity domain-containing protein n=1 Tax=Pedococcus ginsenosidimutans TaxID=490570 RepID=A0ABP8YAB9_9MICO